jgi:hypothetical protein
MTPIEAIYCTMRRKIALGKLAAFEEEAWRLAHLVRNGVLNKQTTIDALQDAADANLLPYTFGEDLVAELMCSAFAEPTAEEAGVAAA